MAPRRNRPGRRRRSPLFGSIMATEFAFSAERLPPDPPAEREDGTRDGGREQGGKRADDERLVGSTVAGGGQLIGCFRSPPPSAAAENLLAGPRFRAGRCAPALEVLESVMPRSLSVMLSGSSSISSQAVTCEARPGPMAGGHDPCGWWTPKRGTGRRPRCSADRYAVRSARARRPGPTVGGQRLLPLGCCAAASFARSNT